MNQCNPSVTLCMSIVHIRIGDIKLVLPNLNLCILDAGILIMVQKVSLMMFSLNMVEYHMSFLSLST